MFGFERTSVTIQEAGEQQTAVAIALLKGSFNDIRGRRLTMTLAVFDETAVRSESILPIHSNCKRIERHYIHNSAASHYSFIHKQFFFNRKISGLGICILLCIMYTTNVVDISSLVMIKYQVCAKFWKLKQPGFQWWLILMPVYVCSCVPLHGIYRGYLYCRLNWYELSPIEAMINFQTNVFCRQAVSRKSCS